jgi:hypothetical protein
MRFKLQTLVDITETKARRGDDFFLQKQQQNYLTTVQTLSLRANPFIDRPPQVDKLNINKLGFGKDYTGTQNVWTFYFEYEVDVDLDFLIKDFDLVPIIDNLEETIDYKTPAFLTNGRSDRNTIIQQIDKYIS